ncbi:MAG TPA: SDR family oxidoreductase [Chloroflexota bacterium]|nr:SDR family oxidoreductase [Chloroflexota bacterium]
MRDMEGKVALVTGAASGIGRATVAAFAERGARIVAADIDVAGGEETIRAVKLAGGEASFVRTDVTSAKDVAAVVQTALSTFGQLDFASNNAGIEGNGLLTADCPEDEWDRVLAVNLKGTWLCLKHEIAAMLDRGGAIVNTSSVYGLVGCRGGGAYAASKHGVNGITRSASLEYARQGIRVNSVCPGAIRTAMMSRLVDGRPEYEERMLRQEPVNRMADPREVAAAITWLCSDAASFITGAEIPVDGGWTAQ